METVTITLDGVEVSGHSTMTILDLAIESGVHIPTLCDDKNLKPYGSCRLCMVEDESSNNLIAACVTPIRSGMIINTRSERVMERRRVILHLMLASHPDSCLICDKGNRCQLRELASEMGIGIVEFQKIPLSSTIEQVNPFIERDMSKCVLCAKCIRACEELVVTGAIDYIDRGFVSRPATLNNMPLETSECTFCGTCVALCPTGALMEKEKTYHGTTTDIIDTICPYCGCGCNLSLEVKDNLLVRAKPGGEGIVNKGTLCVRGSYGYDFIQSPERLTTPLVKINDDFQEISWEQALDHIAQEFKRIKETYSGDSLAVLGSSKCTNEENYLLQRFTRVSLGTNNIDNGSRLYGASSRLGLGWCIGIPGTTNSIEELERSDVIIVIGADPTISAPAVGYAIKRAVKNSGAKLILIDPRQTNLAMFAHLWLRPMVGTDLVLINGMSRVIVREKMFDEEFVTRKTDSFDELSESLESYSPHYIEEITGVPAQDIELAANVFAGAERASIVYGNGITQNINGTDTVMALSNLLMLTGNVGQRRGGIFALQRENNGRGASDMGSLPGFLPGYRNLEDSQARSIFEKRWGQPLPANSGLTALEMIEQIGQDNIKAMLIMGENPVNSFPAKQLVKEALASLEFLVVTDLFLTETAELATVVLPAAGFAEKDGHFTNFEGRVQRIRKAIEPPGESLPDWEIILRLSEKIGHQMPYSSLNKVMEEIEEVVLSYQQQSYEDIDIEDMDLSEMENRSRMRRLYRGMFPNGFGRFAPLQYTPPQDLSRDNYPFTLITGSVQHHFGSGTRSMKAWRLKRFSPEMQLEISQDDSKQLELRNGDKVRIISKSGMIISPTKIVDTLPPGTLFIPISFPESRVNELFDISLDPRSKTPSFKSCNVKLERIDNNG